LTITKLLLLLLLLLSCFSLVVANEVVDCVDRVVLTLAILDRSKPTPIFSVTSVGLGKHSYKDAEESKKNSVNEWDHVHAFRSG
jgi:hypothetical protein